MKILKKLEEKSVYVLWILIGIYVMVFSFVSFLKFKFFGYYDYDLAYFDQIVWNILHGSLYSSILGVVFLGNHVQIIWFFIAPLYFVFPHPVTLLFLQSVALGAAAYPLYLLAKEVLGYKWGLLVSVMYLIYPAIGHMNLFELHPAAFVPFFMFSMLYFFHKEKFGLFMLFLFLAVFCQENISLAAFGMGFYALCKRRSLKWIVMPIILVGFYFLLCFKVIIPYFNNDTIQFGLLYRHLGNSFYHIAVNMLTHPLAVLRIMLRSHNLVFLEQMFGPLCFVSLLSPLWLLAALPLFAQHLLSLRLSQTTIYYQYTAEIIPFVFVAFIFGVKSLLKMKLINRHSFLFGAFLLLVSLVHASGLGPYFNLHQLVIRYQQNDYSLQKEEFIKKIPSDASVVATFEFLSHLTHRRELYSFHHHYTGLYSMSSRPYRLPDSVRYALIDFNDKLTFSSFYSPQAYKNTQRLLSQGRWGVVDVKDNIVLFEKDAENKKILYKVLFSEPQPSRKMSTMIAKEIEFLGYDSSEENQRSLQLTFYWKSLNKTQRDYGILVDVVDPKGKVVFRIERPICYRIYPTNAWAPGQWISEEAYLTIPSFLTGGHYSLEMSFFEHQLGGGRFLNRQDSPGKIFLGEIMVQ